MTDPLRHESLDHISAASAADRDARIEQLLLAGLDHYFLGQYDHAINVWTRVLFFDRSHARARAYIDRARRAQAERQRESEELLHTGTLAYRNGDAKEVRRSTLRFRCSSVSISSSRCRPSCPPPASRA